MSTENCDPLFKGKLDHFNGITINSQQEKCDVELFPQKLKGGHLKRYDNAL